MLKTRVIPCLQLIDDSLVKTVQFKNHNYIGDPINTVRIFNELEVDELCFLDIRATVQKRRPNLAILRQIANECFMPLSYGGGIVDEQTALEVLSIGFEKIVLNTAAIENPKLITSLAKYSGNQSVVVSIDVKRTFLKGYQVFSRDGTMNTKLKPEDWAKKVEDLGAGEILLTSMNNEGTWNGFDEEITKKIVDSVSIPVIANGGAASVKDIGKIVKATNTSAVAVGSMVVYQKKGMGVLINFPNRVELENELISKHN